MSISIREYWWSFRFFFKLIKDYLAKDYLAEEYTATVWLQCDNLYENTLNFCFPDISLCLFLFTVSFSNLKNRGVFLFLHHLCLYSYYTHIFHSWLYLYLFIHNYFCSCTNCIFILRYCGDIWSTCNSDRFLGHYNEFICCTKNRHYFSYHLWYFNFGTSFQFW